MRLAVAIIVLCSGCASAPADHRNIAVSYIPVQVATYTAVTADNIDNGANACRLKAKQSQLGWLFAAPQGQAGQFDEHNVRVSFSLGGEHVYLDANGVLRSKAGDFALPSDDLKKLVSELEASRKAGSCKQYDWLGGQT